MENEFEKYLQKLDLSSFGHGNRKKGTNLIARKIYTFAKSKNLKCEQEVFLGLCRPSNGYRGFVDFTLYSDTNKYAIEIDSSNKKWSLDKLVHARENGYRAIWVRWCSKMNIKVPEIVYLIDLTTK